MRPRTAVRRSIFSTKMCLPRRRSGQRACALWTGNRLKPICRFPTASPRAFSAWGRGSYRCCCRDCRRRAKAACSAISVHAGSNPVDERLRATARQFDQGKKRRVLSTQRIVFLVVAAAAPLAAIIGNLPIALARGNGAGTPGAFLFAGVTLICFAVGYAAMSRRVVNTGAFYTYVAKGLGKRSGLGAAYTAVVAYVSFTIGLAAFFGYFLDLVLSQLNIHFSWLLYAAGGMGAVAILGYRSIDLSSKILGVLMAGERAKPSPFEINGTPGKSAAAFPLESFAPSVVMAPGLGAGVMVAFTSFIGFESAALSCQASKTPTTTMPIATYTSVFLIAAF